MQEYKVDYHIHSTYSDGTMEPLELVEKYKNEGYDEIALTDHDTIDGIKEFIIAGKALKIQVVPGIEISTEYQGIELHILGYRFDLEDEGLNKKIEELKKFREERNKKLIDILNEMGFQLSYEELSRHTKGPYIGKPNIARLLVEKGYFLSIEEAFGESCLGSDPVAALQKEKIATKEAIRVLSQAGGMAVLAHPGKIKALGPMNSESYWQKFEEILKDLKKSGLKGLECIYPNHTKEQENKFIFLAAKYHLHVTEGSDFHGDRER